MNRTLALRASKTACALLAFAAATMLTRYAVALPDGKQTLTGPAALEGWRSDAPGVRRRITPADLPKPFALVTSGQGGKIVQWPEGEMPKAPAGFTVNRFATGMVAPRFIIAAPCGDVFVAESRSNRVTVLRDGKGAGAADQREVFADNIPLPFSIAFYPVGANPQWVYITTPEGVLRYPYQNGDLKARGLPQTIVSGMPTAGHWTRAMCFSKDGRKLYVGLGSQTDAHLDDRVEESQRAVIREYNPDGSGMRVFATGLRNPVSIAVHPVTGDLWTCVNERDHLGDDLPPDYVTRLKDGGFYGWPWFYTGPNEDPRHAGKHPELKARSLVPDVLVGAHFASLGICFYTGNRFPGEYRNDAFVANHGSADRSSKYGYKVIRIPLKNGAPTGEFEDFLTGFVAPNGSDIYGRLVGVATAGDGSLLVSDDGAGIIWRVTYQGRSASK